MYNKSIHGRSLRSYFLKSVRCRHGSWASRGSRMCPSHRARKLQSWALEPRQPGVGVHSFSSSAGASRAVACRSRGVRVHPSFTGVRGARGATVSPPTFHFGFEFPVVSEAWKFPHHFKHKNSKFLIVLVAQAALPKYRRLGSFNTGANVSHSPGGWEVHS